MIKRSKSDPKHTDFIKHKHKNKVPFRENLIDMARDVSYLADKLDVVCKRVAESCGNIEDACADLVGATERVGK